MKKTLVLIVPIIVAIIFYMNFSFFVIQPIGAVPEGSTLVISRVTNIHFIDSADGFLLRTQGGVSLLGRSLVISRVMEQAEIYARLPYFEWMYLRSTGGQTFER